jgi:hypothetical protein
MPAVPPQISSDEEDLLDNIARASSRRALAKLARKAPRESAPDQWGWRVRELIAPLLADAGCGDLIVSVLIRPRQEGYLPPAYAEIFRGGRLIPLSKAPKPGARPIVIGDAFRRLYHRSLDTVSKKDMARYFENSYENCIQYASGAPSGAEKYFGAIQTLIGGDPAPVRDINSPPRPVDPRCTVKLDRANAFNTASRQSFVDFTSGVFEDRTYDQGHIGAHNPPPPIPESFLAHYPSMQAHYDGKARLTMIDSDGVTQVVWCTTGVQQGDVEGGSLFNIAEHSIVGSCMTRHPEVMASMYADNIDLTGPVSKALLAAKDLEVSLAEIGLLSNPEDSAVYIPDYHDSPTPPQAYTDACAVDGMPAIPWAGQGGGIMVLGFPLGPNNFVRQALETVRDNIRHQLKCLHALEDGLVHFHLLRLCTNSKFLYHLRCSLPKDVQAICVEIDEMIWSAFQKFHWDDTIPAGVAASDARIQFRTSTVKGGMGVMPLEYKPHAAFYQATSVALRALSRSTFPPLMLTLADPTFQESPFITAYLAAKEILLDCGAVKTEDFDGGPQDDEPRDGAERPILLPSWAELLADVFNGPLRLIPDQRDLTRLIKDSVNHNPKYSFSKISDRGVGRMAHLQQVTIKATETGSIFADYQPDYGPKATFKHAPLSFLNHTAGVAYTNFPKNLAAAYFAHALGTINPHASNEPCPCGTPAGQRAIGGDHTHHDLTCSKHAAFKSGHDHVVKAVEMLAAAAGIPCTANQKSVPCHSTTQSVGDVHCKLSCDRRSEILDMSMVHPRTHNGSPSPAQKLKTRHSEKMHKHHAAYNCHGQKGFTFVPFVMSTLGRLHPDTQRCLSLLAFRMSQIEVAHRPSELEFHSVVARNTARVHAVVGASIAKGMALRVCGLASGKDSRDPPSRGWRTQLDLLEEREWGDLGGHDFRGSWREE